MSTDARSLARAEFLGRIHGQEYVHALFDRLPDIVYSTKDLSGRYMSMSREGIRRFGLKRALDVVGKSVFDLFPDPMAQRYHEQDEHLLRTGEPIIDNLDLTVYRDGSAGWCMTTKEALRDADGTIIGLACISKDLLEPTRAELIDASLVELIDELQVMPCSEQSVKKLAEAAGLSVSQLNRRMKKIFHLSAGQYLIKVRIDRAARLLAGSDKPLADIALELGFSDQSALSRQFRQATGLTPGQYRQLRSRS